MTTTTDEAATATPGLHPTDGPIHDWFSLSYARYAVLPRTLMQSMPIEWQDRMVRALQEFHDAFGHVPQTEAYDVRTATEHEVSDLTKEQLAVAGITADWYASETPPDGITPEDLAEWKAKHETDAPVYYDTQGHELNADALVLLPAPDPVPDYNRGRTFIPPRITTEKGQFTHQPIVLIRCAVDDCGYILDAEADGTQCFDTEALARASAIEQGWTELLDGRVICNNDVDDDHVSLREENKEARKNPSGQTNGQLSLTDLPQD